MGNLPECQKASLLVNLGYLLNKVNESYPLGLGYRYKDGVGGSLLRVYVLSVAGIPSAWSNPEGKLQKSCELRRSWFGSPLLRLTT